MRKEHKFKIEVNLRCPYRDCGKTFTKTITVIYETNQKGEVISKRAMV